MLSSRRGFTLVELAIVLVILGLLLGAVLKGSQLINAAKLKREVQNLQALQATVWAYYDQYLCLPGDGNSDGHFDGDVAVWNALERANLASRNHRSPYGDNYHFGYGTLQGRTGNFVLVFLPRDAAGYVDSQLDDGNYLTGMVRASGSYVGTGRVNLVYYFE